MHFVFHAFFFMKFRRATQNSLLNDFLVGRESTMEKKCHFLQHKGGPSSHHSKNMQSWGSLRNPIQHIDRLINAQTSQQLLENRLRLKTSIIAVKWLAKQACAFRGHDE